MKCPTCGTENPEGTQFCGSCGTGLTGQVNNQQQTAQQQVPQQQNGAQQQGGMPGQFNVTFTPPAGGKGNGIGVAGFVLALVGFLLGWIPVLNWILWLLGLILSGVGVTREPRGLAIAGLVISLISLIFILVVFASCAAIVGGTGAALSTIH